MSDIIEEVIIDNREELKIKSFKLILRWVIFTTIVVVLFMSLRSIYNSRVTEHNQKMSAMLVDAIENRDDAKLYIETIDYIISNADSNIKDLALIAKGRLNSKKSHYWEEMSKDTNLSITKSYANIVWLSELLNSPKDKKSDDDQVVSKIYKDLNKDQSIFFGYGSILCAAWYIENNNFDEAKKIIGHTINADKIPPLVRDQAEAFLSNINLSQGKSR